jgi:hypothetical protein
MMREGFIDGCLKNDRSDSPLSWFLSASRWSVSVIACAGVRTSGVLRVLAAVCLLLLSANSFIAEAAQRGQTPTAGAVLRLSLGLKDEKPTDWSGSIEASPGEVVGLAIQPPKAGTVQGKSAWEIHTRRTQAPAQKSVHDPNLPLTNRPVVLATINAPGAAKISIRTAQGEFSFALTELRPGAPRGFLNGRLEVEVLPQSVAITRGPEDNDQPAAVRGADGRIWVAYVAYQHAKPIDTKAAQETKDFSTLVAEGNGDQVRLVCFDGKTWGEPIAVTPSGLSVWRPAVAVDGRGAVWVIWSQEADGNWDLYARRLDPTSGRLGQPERLTNDPGADINPIAVTQPTSGKVYVVWQGWRAGNFQILVTSLEGAKAAAEKRLTTAPANHWAPAAAFDSKGKLHVAFDTYEQGNYDVKLISDAAGYQPRTIHVAASDNYEAYPSLAVDQNDRVWIAYEESSPNWGKDWGMKWLGPSGEQMYFRSDVVLRCVEGDRVLQAAGVIPSDPIQRNYPDATTKRLSLPRLAIDGAGRVWLLVRRHPNNSGSGEIWISLFTHHTGLGWSSPAPLTHCENLLDNRPALVPLPQGGVLVVHSSDGRTNGTRTAEQNHLYCSVIQSWDEVKTPQLVALPAVPTAAPVHPTEPEDIRRLRAYRASVGGTTYQLLRGEFHRHTELTSHRDQDGTLEMMWRYALDVAGMDWIGDGDHNNGYDVEYLWWLVQKQTAMYHHPPRFVPMFTYERSVTYPSGHRNAMFPRRGIRPLPIATGKEEMYGTPESGAPDVKTFYAYLRKFGGICASHTSGTGMGTDWRDNDPGVEPVVEIYQGLRQNYEHEGAPGSAKDKADSIGGYQPAGFIWNALRKGYRLGFEVSSDHYSSHISYAVVCAREPSREAIVDAFKKRHCYGANDNIILDVRCGEHMMGDMFDLSGKPELKIHALGTRPIARLSIIRGVDSGAPIYIYDAQPNQQEVNLTWTDAAPQRGKTNYYYVRIEQVPPEGGYGALAWASPMWIRVQP